VERSGEGQNHFDTFAGYAHARKQSGTVRERWRRKPSRLRSRPAQPHVSDLTDNSHQWLLRHGSLPEREIMTGFCPAAVRCPRVSDMTLEKYAQQGQSSDARNDVMNMKLWFSTLHRPSVRRLSPLTRRHGR